MLRHATFCLLVLFAVYVLSSDTAGAADVTASFLEWVGDGIDRTRDFVHSMISDGPEPAVGDEPATTP